MQVKVHSRLKVYNIILAVLHGVLAFGLGILFVSTVRDGTIPLLMPESSVAGLIVIYFVITCGFHIFYAWRGRESGRFRWLEYGITATIMVVVIAVLSGVTNSESVIMLSTLSILMISMGDFYERYNDRLFLVFGFLALACIILVISTVFAAAIKKNGNAPDWIWGILVSMCTLYGMFGFVPITPKKYQEVIYLTLSLVSKATLGILVGFGLSQRK